MEQKTIERYYEAAEFISAQEKGIFDNDMPAMQTRVLPVADWQVLRQELSNIKNDSVFSLWIQSEKNSDCYLVALSDGAYFSWLSKAPYYQ